MSRTTVPFDEPLNEMLLQVAAETVADVVLDALGGRGEPETAAIIDLLAPTDDASGKIWWAAVVAAFEARNADVSEADILLHESGWGNLGTVSRLPQLLESTVIIPDLLRSHATFHVCAGTLDSREELVEAIFHAADIPSAPLPEWLADTVERIASHLLAKRADANWNGFWSDVQQLLSDQVQELAGKKVLLGTDGELHASGEDSSVFFRPQRVGLEEERADESVEEIPSSLQARVAFLHDEIETHAKESKGRLHPTALHGYLSQGLVSTFGVETILRSVLLPAVPEGSIPEGSDAETRCRDILQWGFVLVQNLLARDKGRDALPLLGRLPAPCTGGWYPIATTTFGPGWDGTVGSDVETYLPGFPIWLWYRIARTRRRALISGVPTKDPRHGG